MRFIYKILIPLIAKSYIYEEGRMWDEYTKVWVFSVYIYKPPTAPNMGFVSCGSGRFKAVKLFFYLKKHFKGEGFNCFPNDVTWIKNVEEFHKIKL